MTDPTLHLPSSRCSHKWLLSSFRWPTTISDFCRSDLISQLAAIEHRCQFAGEDSNGAAYASEEALWRSLKRAKASEGGQGDDATAAEGKPWYQGSGTIHSFLFIYLIIIN